MSDFKPVFGIDLGTTYSAIAYIDEHDKPVVIMNQENKLITASVVHFYDKDNFVVGDEAVNMLKADHKNTVSFIKRNMGDTNFKMSIHGKNYSPQEISAFILKQLAKDAQTFFMQKGMDVEVKDVVITIPAYFGADQKGATQEAGELAGLNVLRIMNEPTAAALAFGINKLGKDQTVFVFDLGGGTFDVTILNIKGNEINMVASDGDPELGGKEWDDALLGYCADLFKMKYGEDPQDDPSSFQELYGRVVSAKLSLSKKPKTKIVFSHGGNSETLDISREKFEELSKDRLSQCRSKSESVLKKANMKWGDIDTVLLVGGSTYMPMVRSLVKEISGKDPSTEVNPDQCVAVGAAFQARYGFIDKVVDEVAAEKGEKEAEKVRKNLLGRLPPITVKECVAKPIGIIVLDENKSECVLEMIPEQADIPFREEGAFGYAYDNMTSVKVEVTEGKGKKRDQVSIIGEIVLENLPPRPEGTPIQIIYNFNKNQTLDVEVIDVQTGKKQNGKVVLEGSMNAEEKRIAREHIAQMKHD